MAISFDPVNRRIVLDSASVTAEEIFSRWEDWAILSDNSKYLPAFRHAGGDELGGGLLIPNYMFLLNGWRVRPMEANHTLVITGNLFVEGGGVPVVQTLGSFNVSTQYTVPVQAQGISTGGGGGSSPTASAIASAVRSELALELARIDAAISSISGGGGGGGSAPTAIEVAAAVRSNLAVELARVDTPISTRMVVGGGGAIHAPSVIAAAVWDRPLEDEITAQGFMRLLASVALGDASELNGPNPVFMSMNGMKVRVSGVTTGTTRTINGKDTT